MLCAAPAARADAEYDACVQRADTNVDFSTCGSALIGREDGRLNASWRHLMTLVGEPSRTDLLKEQRAWLAYKEKSCLVLANGEYGRDGQVMQFPVCRAAVIAQRTKELEDFAAFFRPQ